MSLSFLPHRYLPTHLSVCRSISFTYNEQTEGSGNPAHTTYIQTHNIRGHLMYEISRYVCMYVCLVNYMSRNIPPSCVVRCKAGHVMTETN